MDLLKRIEGTVTGVEHRVVGAGEAVASGANDVAHTGFVHDALNLGKDTVSRVGFAASRVGSAVVHAPAAVGTWGRLYHAFTTGQRTLLPGQMPAYPTLDPTQLANAEAAGAGRKVPQNYLRDNRRGTGANEPVTIQVTASKADLVRALERQGWTRNDGRTVGNYIRQGLAVLTHYNRVSNGPVSEQYLNGKLEDMAFSKNCDYNLSRDHMRIYQTGTDPKTGLPVWAIACSRDEAATVTIHRPDKQGPFPWQWKFKAPSFGHETDKAVDGERDLIMHDLLASGQVTDWAAVDTTPGGPEWKRQRDGSVKVGNYTSADGKLYQVSLGPAQ